MPAPKRTPANDVRDAILDEATRAFAARGFDGSSLQEIAAAVGIRKPSLLYHFESKDALRVAVFQRLLGHWGDVLPRLLAAAASGEARFEAVLAELVRFFVDDPDRARLMLRELLDRPTELRALLAGNLTRWVAIVADYIRRGQHEGRIRPDVDPEAYVLHVIELVVGAIATASSLGALLPGDRRTKTPSARFLAEITRIAKSALFVDGPSERSGRARARPGGLQPAERGKGGPVGDALSEARKGRVGIDVADGGEGAAPLLRGGRLPAGRIRRR